MRARPAPTEPPAALGRPVRRAIGALCATELTSWGILFYALPVLIPAIVADTGWSPITVTAAFSAGQVVSASCAVPVGRVVDLRGPRMVMTGGSLLGVLALCVVATARDPVWFTAGWMAAGAAMSAVLYEPAFAAATRWCGPRRVPALTAITLAGGLASTVFAPTAAFLGAVLGWRGALLTLAGVLLLITVPLHALLLRPQWTSIKDAHASPARRRGGARVARTGAFAALLVSTTIAAFATGVSVVHLPLMLTGRGLDPTLAAIVLGVGGIGQVLGRTGFGAVAARTGVTVRTVGVLVALSVTTALLGLVPGPLALLIALSLLGGAARGFFTLVRATAVSERWGVANYATLSGILAAPAIAVGALAPWGGSLLAVSLGSYPPVYLVLAGLFALSAAVVTLARPRAC